jgi:Zn-dependent protease
VRHRARHGFVHFPVPVTIGAGGFLPPLALGGLFAGIGLELGMPVALGAVIGATAGTASLLVHEFGHIRAARGLDGIRPVGVTLVWLGAGACFEGAYRQGRDQVRVAVAGPLASFLTAAAIFPVMLAPIPPTAKKFLLVLVLLNVGLAVANLIPASPMDGYRILSGLLWSALGSERTARTVIRRAAKAWMGVEVAATAAVMVEKPMLGTVLAIVGASLFGQKLAVRSRSAHS